LKAKLAELRRNMAISMPRSPQFPIRALRSAAIDAVKKRKLQLKDLIARIEDSLLPILRLSTLARFSSYIAESASAIGNVRLLAGMQSCAPHEKLNATGSPSTKVVCPQALSDGEAFFLGLIECDMGQEHAELIAPERARISLSRI